MNNDLEQSDKMAPVTMGKEATLEGSEDNGEKNERAWCWVMCFAAFCIILMRNGLLISSGILFGDIVKEFKQSKSKTGTIFNVNSVICFSQGGSFPSSLRSGAASAFILHIILSIYVSR